MHGMAQICAGVKRPQAAVEQQFLAGTLGLEVVWVVSAFGLRRI